MQYSTASVTLILLLNPCPSLSPLINTVRPLNSLSQAAEEAPARLLQALILCRYGGVRWRAGDACGARVLRPRQDRVRLRLPVRSGERHDVHARDPAHHRGHRHAEGRQGKDLARQPRGDHRREVQELRSRAYSSFRGAAEGCEPGIQKPVSYSLSSWPGMTAERPTLRRKGKKPVDVRHKAGHGAAIPPLRR